MDTHYSHNIQLKYPEILLKVQFRNDFCRQKLVDVFVSRHFVLMASRDCVVCYRRYVFIINFNNATRLETFDSELRVITDVEFTIVNCENSMTL